MSADLTENTGRTPTSVCIFYYPCVHRVGRKLFFFFVLSLASSLAARAYVQSERDQTPPKLEAK